MSEETTLKQQFEQKQATLQQVRYDARVAKWNYLRNRFPEQSRCRVTLLFDDGHNGATQEHRLLGRISASFKAGINFRFDTPYRFVREITILFDQFVLPNNVLHDCDFFTMQGIATVVRVDRVRRKTANTENQRK